MSDDTRFDLPECRNEALLLATNAIELGIGDVKDEALQWLDCALNDALVEVRRLQEENRIRKRDEIWQETRAERVEADVKRLQAQLDAAVTPLERGLRRALLEGGCLQPGCSAERFRTKTGTVCANGHVGEL